MHPLENKDKDDALKSLLREIMKVTPIYFPDYVVEYFPKVLKDFFLQEQTQLRNERMYIDSSFVEYKNALRNKVNEDYSRFITNQLESFHSNNQSLPINTLLCIVFKFLQDENVQQNVITYLGIVLK